MPLISVIAPVFLVIALGFILARTGFLKTEFLKELNKLTYNIALPAFLFQSTATAHDTSGRALVLTGVIICATLLALAIAWATAKALKMPNQMSGAFMQGAFRGNIAYIGLPIVALATQQAFPGEAAQLTTLAALVLAPMVAFYNLAAVFVLIGTQPREGSEKPLRTAALQLLTNPLLIASIAGALVAWSNIAPPVWLTKTIDVVAQLALPAALICIGGTLATTALRGRRTAAAIATAIKLVALPLIGIMIGKWLGLSPGENLIAAIFLTCPTAAASFTLAGKLGGDEALAATIVVLSTVLSIVSLSAALLIFS